VGLSAIRISKIETSEVAGIYPSTARKLADLFKMQVEKFLLELSATKIEDGEQSLSNPVETPQIPEFNLAVAAGPWTDVVEVGELHNRMNFGVFRIKIGGDSMEPMWPNGSRVEFKNVQYTTEPLVEGEDYYVQVDSLATFKRLEKLTPEEMVFRALNKKKYPKPFVVRTEAVIQMARAENIIVDPRKR